MLGLQFWTFLNFGCQNMYFLYAIKAVVYTTEANEPSLIVKDAMKFYFIIDYSPL